MIRSTIRPILAAAFLLLTNSGFALVVEPADPIGILLDHGHQLLRSRPSHPTKKSMHKVRSQSDRSIVNTFVTEVSPGLSVSYCSTCAGDVPVPSQIVVSGASVPLPLSIKFGGTPDSIKLILGKPERSSKNQLEYVNTGDGYPHSITFHFKAGRLVRIDWDFVID